MKRQHISLFIILIISLMLLAIPSASAQKGTLILLAVTETEQGYVGQTADLLLEIKPGQGNVYLSTFPLSKIDTQMSARLAKNIACKYTNIDCSRYDFYYEIKAKSSILSGPSAGGALTFLTFALLTGTSYDKDVAMTGTINSGYLIGPVGEVKEKIDAAYDAGIKKVLIPVYSAKVNVNESKAVGIFFEKNITDKSSKAVIAVEKTQEIDLVEYGRSLNMTIVPVSDLADAIYGFTGKKDGIRQQEIALDQSYGKTMSMLAGLLCSRYENIKTQISKLSSLKKFRNDSRYVKLDEEAKALMNSSLKALANKEYYSAASYCFGADVKSKQMYYLVKDPSPAEMVQIGNFIKQSITKLRETIKKIQKKTLSDLEAYITVEQRLRETEEFLDDPDERETYLNLGYAEERLQSAYSWSEFFGKPGKEFNINKDTLKDSCEEKIAEADEYINYLSLSLPADFIKDIAEELEQAMKDNEDKEYELCLFTATEAKARANIILETMSILPDKLEMLRNEKIKAAANVINSQTKERIFPILGYSYYEYAKSLNDTSNSLVYAEYSIEMSNIDMYLNKKKIRPFYIEPSMAYGFVFGLSLGIVITLIVLILVGRFMYMRKKSANSRHKKAHKRR